MTQKVICPDCGADMILRQTTKYQFKNGANRVFYGCSRYPDCQAIRPSHPDGTVYGVPGDKETREWRMKAHAEFDRLWKSYKYSRNEAYSFLANLMQLPAGKAHISSFTKEQCQELVKKMGYKII